MSRIKTNCLLLFALISLSTISCKKDLRSPAEMDAQNRNQVPGYDVDPLPNNVIIDWSIAAFDAAGGAAEAHPLLAVRNEAMMHIAMHDALNSIRNKYERYAYFQNNPDAHPIAAAASAAHTVLTGAWGTSAALDTRLSTTLAAIPNGPAKTQGIALGLAAGNAILAQRAGDGAYQDPIGALPPSTVPGVYVAVPPFTFAFAPFWKTMQLFSLEEHDQFRSAPPTPLSGTNYAKDFNEVKRVGRLNSAFRTADQTFYAHWWYEFSDIGWNRIGRVLATSENTGLYTTARMFALLNMAMHDAYTAGWDSKYFYNFWRPYTAIRMAATDGNNQTIADPTWEPEMPTPPVPDYPSTHSAVGNAAANVLEDFFGHHASFSMTSTSAVPAGAMRSFTSLRQAAEENADSRVMAGIHFRSACNAGLRLGEKVGKWTLQHHLQRIH